MATTCLTLNPLDFDVFPDWVNGWCQSSKTWVPVEYDYKDLDSSEGSDAAGSIQQGADLLDTMIGTYISGGPVYVLAHSKGAQVVGRWMLKYASTSGYSTTNLKFICTGSPASPKGITWYKYPTPESNYGFKLIDIGRQYDGWCRWPQGFQVLRVFEFIQSLIGMLVGAHLDYKSISLDATGNPTSYISTETVGDTTYYTCA